MLLKLPYKALSTNEMYLGRKVISAKYKKFQQQVSAFLALNYPKGRKKLEGNLVMELEVGFSSPLSDCSNAIKSIEDVVAAFYGFNDRQIVSHRLDKFLVDKGSEYMVVKLRKTKKNIDRRTSGKTKSKGSRVTEVRV